MIKGIINELSKDDKLQQKIKEVILNPLLKNILIYFAPYFVILTMLNLMVIILLIINIYYAN